MAAPHAEEWRDVSAANTKSSWTSSTATPSTCTTCVSGCSPPELIALPDQFAQMVATITDLAERFAAFVETTDKRLTAIEAHVGTLKEDVGTLKENVGTLKNDQSHHEG